jgi:hypothetical protein
MTTFTASHVERTHAIRLHAGPHEVFPLFDPLGERLWAPGWEPHFLYPQPGKPEAGAVFTTRQDRGQAVIWTIAALDGAGQRIEYLRVTPEEQLARIAIRCAELPDGTTEARVTYSFTALAEAGNAFVLGYTDAHHRERIAGWERAINHYLQHGRPLGHAAHPLREGRTRAEERAGRVRNKAGSRSA